MSATIGIALATVGAAAAAYKFGMFDQKKSVKLIIAGAPGSGKGTQCEMLVEKYGCVQISTGDILRAEAKAGTALGKQADALMKTGALVPDELVINIVKSRMAQADCKANGWLLDGFPRTAGQADAMAQAGIVADAFVYLKVPDSLLLERITGRRSDPVTGKGYHIKFSPATDPVVAARLTQRKDDTEEALKSRLAQFHANIAAVRGKFADKLFEVDGTKKKEEVFSTLVSIIEKKPSAPKL